MKALQNIDRIQISSTVLKTILTIYEKKGASFYHDSVLKKDADAFKRKNVEDNLFALYKMLEFDVTDARLSALVKKDLTPKNKTEQRMQNIKRVIELIHEHEDIELTITEFSDLAKLLSKSLDQNQYNTTVIEGEALLNQKKISKREDLEALLELTNKLIKKQDVPVTHLIANFYVDFINLAIFKYDNDLIGLFMAYALLTEHFKALYYVPFFSYFLQYYQAFKQAEVAASYYWNSGYAQTEFLTQILLDVLILCYEDIEKRVHTYQFEVKLNKTDSIENTIYKLPELFSKEDVRIKHPTVSNATIDRTLARLRDEGKIRPLGKGRATKWQQLIEKQPYTKMKQLSLFGDDL